MNFIELNAFNFFSLILSLLLFLHAKKYFKRGYEKKWSLILLLFIFGQSFDIISTYLETQTGTIFIVFSYLTNILLFSTATVLSVNSALFFYKIIEANEKKLKIVTNIFRGFIIFNFLLLLLSIPFGLVFSISANSVYSRGPLYTLMIIVIFTPVLFMLFNLITNKTKKYSKNFFNNKELFVMSVTAIAITMGLIYLQGRQIVTTSLVYSPISLLMLILHLIIVSRSLKLDYLTGIQNKFGIEMYLDELPKKLDSYLVVVFFDLDNLKEINDTKGHFIGDKLIIKFSQILLLESSKDMLVGRLGGDEFLMIMQVKYLNKVDEIIKNIKQKTESFNKNNKTDKIEYSYGISYIKPGELIDKYKLIEEADEKMYNQKYNKKAR